MNTNSIGKFIQELRKEKNITQRELADTIGISDKTISKWENGISLPDTSMLMSLCKALDISVNELLSGERILPENYNKKAEENIMNLMKKNEENTKGNIFLKFIGLIFLMISVFLLISGKFVYFIDAPSFILVAFLSVGIIFLSGIKDKNSILYLLSKIIIPIGCVISLSSAIIIMVIIDNPSKIGPNLAVAFLSLLYSFIIKIVVEFFISKSTSGTGLSS